VVVRPEQIAVSATATETATAIATAGATLATVVGRSFYGHDGVVRLRVDGSTTTISARLAGQLPERGDTVTVNSVVWVVVGTEVDTDEGNAVLSCVTPEAVA
jgi:hypothetical protein